MKGKNFTSFHGSISLSNIASHGSKKSDAMLGSSNGIGSGGIDHQTTKFGGSLQIHIIYPDPSSADDLQTALGGLKYLAGDFGATPNNEGVAKGDLGAEVFRGQAIRTVNVPKAPEQVKAGFSQLLGDEDGGLGNEGIDVTGLGEGDVGRSRIDGGGLEDVEKGNCRMSRSRAGGREEKCEWGNRKVVIFIGRREGMEEGETMGSWEFVGRGEMDEIGSRSSRGGGTGSHCFFVGFKFSGGGVELVYVVIVVV